MAKRPGLIEQMHEAIRQRVTSGPGVRPRPAMMKAAQQSAPAPKKTKISYPT